MTQGDPHDKDLLEQSRHGDREAYERLFERHADELRRYIGRWLPAELRRRVSVSDVLQEARIVAHQRLSTFEDRGPNSFRNWLLRIAEMKTKAAVRWHAGTAKRAAHREAPTNAEGGTSKMAAVFPSPSEWAIGIETEELINRAMETLSADHRQILQLALKQRLPLREAAERMDRSREAAKKLYGRALSRFTDELERLRGERHERG